LDFASGRELVAVKDRHGLNRSNASIWVGSDRVAEIAAAEMGNKEEVKSAGDRLRIALWDARSGELLNQVKAPNAVWLCPSPDGKQIAEAGADKRVRLRNGQTLEVEQEFRCHEDALTGVAWHPTLPLVVTEASDGMVRVWNSRDFRKVEEFQTPAHRASRREDASHYRLEMTAEGRELNVHRGGQILVFQPESFQEKNR